MMHRSTLTTVSIFAALVVAASAVGASPRATEESDKLVLANDVLTVQFADKAPRLGLFATAALAEAAGATDVAPAFEYTFERVIEYRDLDASGTPDANEVVAYLPLAESDAWTATLADEAGAATLTLDLTAPAVLAGPLAEAPIPDREATVRLAFHLFAETREIEAGEGSFLVTPAAVKYDFAVDAWPWIDADGNRLALEMLVTGALERDNAPGVDSAVVSAKEAEIGSLSWTTMATGTDAQDAEIEVPVTAVLAPVAPAEKEDAEKLDVESTRVTFAYDAPGLATLAHDPTIAIAAPEPATEEAGQVTDRLKDVPAPGALLGLAAVGAVALAARRKFHG